MSDTIEARLVAVEAAVVELRQQQARPKANRIEQVTGSSRNEPAFEEVLAYGRAMRQAGGGDGDRCRRGGLPDKGICPRC
jgi:hypothetical protein